MGITMGMACPGGLADGPMVGTVGFHSSRAEQPCATGSRALEGAVR